MLTPERLVEKLVLALGPDLRTALLYGSAAAAHQTHRYIDLNLMLVVTRADPDTLARIAIPMRDWVKGGQPAPLVVSFEEVERSQDVFPIEFQDIKARHRILHGESGWISKIDSNPGELRHQLEFELRSKLLLLRRAYLSTGGRPEAEEDAAARTLSSFAALFRATLRLMKMDVPAATLDVIQALQSRVSIDVDAWELVWQMRQGRRPPQASNFFPRIIAGLETLVRFVDAYPAS